MSKENINTTDIKKDKTIKTLKMLVKILKEINS